MAYIEWSNDYNVAVKKFNDDHKKLFDYINDLHRGMTSGFTIADMSYILKELIDYTRTHFKTEEKLMEKFDYPDLESHREEHAKLLEQVDDYYTDFQKGKKAFTLTLLQFLNEWITNHILDTDMKYKSFFKEVAKNQTE